MQLNTWFHIKLPIGTAAFSAYAFLTMKKLIYFLFLLHPLSAHSAFQNINSIVPGDRASGMGGAGTALLGDISSAAFYNPGILGATEGKSFSAAVGVYKKFDTLYGDSADYTKTPLRINTGFFRALPASSGNIVEIQDWKVGMSIIVPDYEQFKGDLANTDSQTTNLSYTDESLWVGAAAAKKISDTSSFGFTLYYTARNYVRSLQDKTYSGVASRIYTSDLAITQNSVVAILGYFAKASENTHWGASLRLPNLSFSSTASYFEDEIDTQNLSNNSKTNRTSLGATDFIPAQLRLGITHKPAETWLLSSDISLSEGRSFYLFDLNSKSDRLVYKPVANINLGLEKKIFPELSARLGVFSNLSAHPEPDINKNYLQGEHVHQAGFSANLHYVSGSKIGYSFGGYYTGGNGYSIIRSAHQFVKTTKSTHVFTMLVGTSFYF